MASPVLIQLAEVDSTQVFLRRHTYLWNVGVLARAQTAGQGRSGHKWESLTDQGLWLSAALPRPKELSPLLMPMRAMEGVLDVLQDLHLDLGLKWPNDLMARREGGLFKLGGLIGELAGNRLLLGLGLNLLSSPCLDRPVFPAISLLELGVHPLPDPQQLASRILDRWTDLNGVGFCGFRWPEPGQEIQWEGGQGRVLAWTPEGPLAVQTDQGVEELVAGEIRGLKST